MRRVDDYRATLRELPDEEWDSYLTQHSGLPGPRGNLELMHAVAEEAPAGRLVSYARMGDEFFAACGVVGLGRLFVEGDDAHLVELRRLAADDRWRVREAVAMALQIVGDTDLELMLSVARDWASDPSPLVRRASIAGLCEPRLLVRPEVSKQVLAILDQVTHALSATPAAERRSDSFRVLRQALGYCWSVAVAALPTTGFGHLDRWGKSEDGDVRWIIKQNLKKARLRRADAQRTQELQDRFSA